MWAVLIFAAVASGLVSWDFESGTLEGWRVVSGNLPPQPTAAEDDRWGDRFGKQGRYFIGTCELPGGGFDDRRTGELRSPEFTIRGDFIRLLVGGGAHPNECFVALVDAQTGRELARATGRNAEFMMPVYWDVRRYKGRRVFIRIVDRHTGGWGHINVDDIREMTAEQVLKERQRRRNKQIRDIAEALAWMQKQPDDSYRRPYTGDHLAKIAVPVGGIGTGSVYLCGDGDLRGWQIFNHVNLAAEIPYNFLAVFMKPPDGPARAYVCQRDGIGPLPGLEASGFRAEYPEPAVSFRIDDLNLLVIVTASSPLVPSDAEASSLPVIFFDVELLNYGQPVKAAAMLCVTNTVGWDGYQEIRGLKCPSLGRNWSRSIVLTAGEKRGRAVEMGADIDKASPGFGTMIAAAAEPASTAAGCPDIRELLEQFARTGSVGGPSRAGPTAPGRTHLCAIVKPLSDSDDGLLRQYGSASFLFAWHFPNRFREWAGSRGKYRVGNWYSRYGGNARQIAERVLHKIHYLTDQTDEFRFSFWRASTWPRWLAECLAAHIASARSPLVMWLEDGTVAGFEGLREREGCCPMNCTHVYNYAQTIAFLWPELERRMRELELSVQMMPNGLIRHRVNLPLSLPRTTGPAVDGHLGTILKAYRETLMCPDLSWLRKWWPKIKRAMDAAMENWDADGNGIIEGPQWNTYDCYFYGANTYTGTLYLAALRAAEEMAKRVGDSRAASRYRERFEIGRRNLDRICWREDLGYYVQVYDADRYTQHQWGIGCLADQLIGQWWADLLGLGPLLPPEHIRRALNSILVNNWRRGFTAEPYHHRYPGEDMGLINCTWPYGDRPGRPVNYADGIWTGVEYEVAAEMIYQGLVQKGLLVARAARSRFDGRRRNPFDEPECGHHYARPMSSWSLLLALSGVRVDGPAGLVSIERFAKGTRRWLVTWPEGWGMVTTRLEGGTYELWIGCDGGRARIARLRLRLPPGHWDVSPECAGDFANVRAEPARWLSLEFRQPVVMEAGERLQLKLARR